MSSKSSRSWPLQRSSSSDYGQELNALHALRERMNRLFEDELPQAQRQGGGAFAPATDVYLTEDRVVITIELPGVDPTSVAVRGDGLRLSISGERPQPAEGHCHQAERSFGPFLRTLALPPGSDLAQRQLTFQDGLLTIELPRQAQLRQP